MDQSTWVIASRKKVSLPVDLVARLRVAEKVILGFFIYALAASLVFPLSLRERLTILVLNLTVGALVLMLGKYGAPERSVLLVVVRDWLPCVLILLAYREAGLFFRPDPTHRLDYIFERWDSVLLVHPWVVGALTRGSPWLQRYLEFSYLLCYPLVPLGLGSLYLAPRIARGSRPTDAARKSGAAAAVAEQRSMSPIDRFWTAVLLAALTCYVLFPFFPLTPPRELFRNLPGPEVEPLLRKMNLWVLARYAVGASLFPSGHVAAVTATALAVRAHLPRLGLLFLIAAVSIALATIYGRYHYGADALAGALVGLAAFLLSNRLHRSQPLHL